jgi:electron transport complex protein RnfG
MDTEASARSPLKVLGAVAAVAALAAVIVTGSYELSRERIAANERQRQLTSLQEAAGMGPNTDAPTALPVPLSDASAGEPTELFALFTAREPPIFVFAVTAPDGYNGAIRMLVGITSAGQVTGVRVVSHRETPGLGDAIERTKSDWIEQFAGKSLHDPALWAVKKDGGSFDALTGATVTPRAVIRAVSGALAYYERHGAALRNEARQLRDNAHE